MSDLDEIGKLDELDQHRTRRGAEFSSEEAQLLDELLASADISLPPSPEVRPDRHMTGTEAASQYVGTEMPSKYIAPETWSPDLDIGTSQGEVASAPAVLEQSGEAEAPMGFRGYNSLAPTVELSDDTATLGERSVDEPVTLDQHGTETSTETVGVESGSAEIDTVARYELASNEDSRVEYAQQPDQLSGSEDPGTPWTALGPIYEMTSTETVGVESGSAETDGIARYELASSEDSRLEYAQQTDQLTETEEPGTPCAALGQVDEITANETVGVESGSSETDGLAHYELESSEDSRLEYAQQPAELTGTEELGTPWAALGQVDEIAANETVGVESGSSEFDALEAGTGDSARIDEHENDEIATEDPGTTFSAVDPIDEMSATETGAVESESAETDALAHLEVGSSEDSRLEDAQQPDQLTGTEEPGAPWTAIGPTDEMTAVETVGVESESDDSSIDEHENDEATGTEDPGAPWTGLDQVDETTALETVGLESESAETDALAQFEVGSEDSRLEDAQQADQPAGTEEPGTPWTGLDQVDETTDAETVGVESGSSETDTLDTGTANPSSIDEHENHESPGTEDPVTSLSAVNPADEMTAVDEHPDEEGQSGEPEAHDHDRVGTFDDSPFNNEELHDEPAGTEQPGAAWAADNLVDQMTAVETRPHEKQTPPATLELRPQEPEATSSPEQIAPVPFSLAEPMTYAGSRSGRRSRPAIVAVLVAILFLAALGAGFVALKQSKSTSQWRQRALSAESLNGALVTRDGVLSKVLVSDRSAVASQQSETSKLTGQVASLQTQLSALSKTREKTLAKNVLTRLASQASTVSNSLAACVNDTTSLRVEIDSDLAAPSHKDAHLEANTQAADAACATARRDNLQLQSTLRGAQ